MAINRIQLRIRQDNLISYNKTVADRLKAGISPDDMVDKSHLSKNMSPTKVLIASKLAETYMTNVGTAYEFMPHIIEQAYGKDADDNKVLMDLYETSKPFSVKPKYNTEMINKQIEEEAKAIDKIKSENINMNQIDLDKYYEKIDELAAKAPDIDEWYKNIDQNIANEGSAMYTMYSNAYWSSDPEKQEFFDEYSSAETEKEKSKIKIKRYTQLLEQRQDKIRKFENWEQKQKERILEPQSQWTKKIRAFESGGARIDIAAMDIASNVIGLAGKICHSKSMAETSDGLAQMSHAWHKALDDPDLHSQANGAFDEMTNSLFQNVPYISLATVSSIATGGSTAAIFLSSAAYEGSGIYHDSISQGIPDGEAKIRGFIGGVINGALESAGGGATKYLPKTFGKKLAGIAGTMTKNMFKEIFMEELPQEVVSTILSKQVPYNEDGTLNWNEITDRVIRLARDTAFMSFIMTSVGTTVELNNDIKSGNKSAAAEKVIQAWNDLQEVSKNETFGKGLGTGENLLTQTESDVQTQGTETNGVGAKEKPLEAKQGVRGGEIKVFRGDSVKIDPSQFDLNRAMGENIKDLGGIFAEGPGVYFTTNKKTAQGFGKNVSERNIPTEKFIDQKTAPLDRTKIEKIIDSFDAETVELAASNWAEDFEHGKQLLIDTIMEEETAFDQLIGIWAEISYHQNPETFVDIMVKNGIDGTIVDKTGEQYLIVYNKSLLEQYAASAKQDVPNDNVKTKQLSNTLDVKTPDTNTEISELIDAAPSYGVFQNEDGKYSVIDWNTQKEIKSGMEREEAQQMSRDMNAAQTPDTLAEAVPDSEMILTTTFNNLISQVLGKSNTMRQAAINGAKHILAIHKDIYIQAKKILKEVSINNRQRNAILKRLSEAKNDKQRMEAISYIIAVSDKQHQINAIAEYKKIRSMVNRASKLRRRDGGIPAHIYNDISELMKGYSLLSSERINALKRSKTYLDGIRKNTGDIVSEKIAVALMPKSLLKSLENIDAQRLQEMTAEEITDLNSSIRQYLKNAQTYNRLIDAQQLRTAKAFIDYHVANIKFQDKYKINDEIPRSGTAKTLYNSLLGSGKDDFYTLATKIWGKEGFGINLKVMRMRRKINKIMLSLENIQQEVANEIGIDELSTWSDDMSFFESKLGQKIEDKFGSNVINYTFKIGNTSVDFTMAELISFYMGSGDQYWFGQAVKNGIGTAKKGMEFREVGKINEDTIRKMITIVETNPSAMKYIGALEKIVSVSQKLLNQTSRKLHGIDIATVKDRWHVEYVPEKGVTGTQFVRESIVDENGALKSRTSSNRHVVIRDVFQVLAEDIRVVSNFAGGTETLMELRMLSNSTSFNAAMKKAGQSDLVDDFNNRIKATQRDVMMPQSKIVRLFSKLSSNVRKNILTGLQVIGVQPLSIMLYHTETELKYMKTAVLPMNSSIYSDVMANWTMGQIRESGKSNQSSIVSHSGIRKMVTGKGTSTDVQLAPLHKGDMYGITRAAKITMSEMSDSNLSGLALSWWQDYGVDPSQLEYGTQEFWDAFNDRADWLATLTQPMFNPENKSSYANSDNALLREFFVFRSFVEQLLRIPARQIALMRYGQISKKRGVTNIANALVLASITKVLVQTFIGAALGKKKEAKEILAEMVTAPLSILPIVGYPAQKYAMKAMGINTFTPSFSTVGMMTISSIFRHIGGIATGIGYLFDDEYISSGKYRGDKKSTKAFKENLPKILKDFLVIRGIPVRAIDQIKWFENEPEKR